MNRKGNPKANRKPKVGATDLSDVSGTVVAAALRITHRRLQQLIAEGTLPTPKRRGHYDLVEYVRAWIEHRIGRGDEALAKMRREREAQELRVAKARADAAEGTAISREEHEEIVTSAANVLVRDLEGLPGRLAGVLGIRNPALIEKVDDEIRRIRETGARKLRERVAELRKDRAA